MCKHSLYVDKKVNIYQGKSLQSGRHPQCVLALILNKQGIDTQSTAIPIKQMV